MGRNDDCWDDTNEELVLVGNNNWWWLLLLLLLDDEGCCCSTCTCAAKTCGALLGALSPAVALFLEIPGKMVERLLTPATLMDIFHCRVLIYAS